MADAYRIKIKVADRELEIQGDKEYVEKKLAEFHDKLFADWEKVLHSSINRVEFTDSKSAELHNIDVKDLIEFYRTKLPKDFNETVLTFGYYLHQIKGLNNFNQKDILRCFQLTNVPVPTNISQHLHQLVKKHMVILGSRIGNFKLTADGKKFVEHLPEASLRRNF